MKTSWPVWLLSSLFALSVAHADVDVDIGINAEIRLGKSRPPPPPDVIIVEPVGPAGPPPWAPAHGFRRNRAYYFYPGYDVYYRPADHLWFYLEGGNWRTGVVLPDHVHVDFGHSVALTMETDQPYRYHPQVITYYPTGYFAKVKFKEHPGPGPKDHRSDKPSHKAKESGREKNHGKGKGRD